MEGGKYFEEFCQIASENSDNLFSYTYEFRINLYPGLNENIEQAKRTTASDEEAVCYVIVFIVSYRGITNSRFSLTQSKPYIF